MEPVRCECCGQERLSAVIDGICLNCRERGEIWLKQTFFGEMPSDEPDQD